MLVTDDVDVLHTATHIITTTKETENANLRIDLKMHVSMCTDTWTMVPTQQDHPCVCGRTFTTETGMKVHRMKKGYAYASLNAQKHSVPAMTDNNKMSGDLVQVLPHNAENAQAGHCEDACQFPSDGLNIKFPPS